MQAECPTTKRTSGPWDRGPYTIRGGATREATFDTATFAQQLPDTLHTIPAANSLDEHHELLVRLITGLDLRGEGMDPAADQGHEGGHQGSRHGHRRSRGGGVIEESASKDKQFEHLMAKDPVFKQIARAREKKGPNRPVNDDERAQLGTRADLRDVSGNTAFWKILEKGNLDGRQNKYAWSREGGGPVPPWFPDLDECKRCTIGAAYAKSRDGYTLRDVTLVCMNREHYQQKLNLGEAAYRGTFQSQEEEIDRQDARSVKHLMRQLEPLTDDACLVLAASLVAANPALAWTNPLGFYDEDWSYESGLVKMVSDLLGAESLVRHLERTGRLRPGHQRRLHRNPVGG